MTHTELVSKPPGIMTDIKHDPSRDILARPTKARETASRRHMHKSARGRLSRESPATPWSIVRDAVAWHFKAVPRVKLRLHDRMRRLLFRTRPAAAPQMQFAYRLRAWPALRSTLRTAGVMQALTRMELGPVSRRWFVAACRLPPAQAVMLLDNLVQDGYVQELSVGGLAVHEPQSPTGRARRSGPPDPGAAPAPGRDQLATEDGAWPACVAALARIDLAVVADLLGRAAGKAPGVDQTGVVGVAQGRRLRVRGIDPGG
ncbi:MAG: hypothetical protein NVS2B4_10350 [Ramlibacter sp.]